MVLENGNVNINFNLYIIIMNTIKKLNVPDIAHELIINFTKPKISIRTVGIAKESRNRVIYGEYDDLLYQLTITNKTAQFAFTSENINNYDDAYLKEIESDIINYINDNIKNFVLLNKKIIVKDN
jgi:hypothetical protein